jgi:hypothetical protein
MPITTIPSSLPLISSNNSSSSSDSSLILDARFPTTRVISRKQWCSVSTRSSNSFSRLCPKKMKKLRNCHLKLIRCWQLLSNLSIRKNRSILRRLCPCSRTCWVRRSLVILQKMPWNGWNSCWKTIMIRSSQKSMISSRS